MKKHIFVLPLLSILTMPAFGVCEKDFVHLNCTARGITHDVTVTFLSDGAILNIDGNEYELKQQYDACVEFNRTDPWYNLQIGNRDNATKYSLGIPDYDGVALYSVCDEIE